MIATAVKYVMLHKEQEEAAAKFGKFTNEVVYRGFFFILLSMLLSVQVGTAFGAVVAFLYLPAVVLLFIGHFKPNPMLKFVGHIVQAVVFLVMILYVIANPWCRYAFFRFNSVALSV